jgi:hypothetical protein
MDLDGVSQALLMPGCKLWVGKVVMAAKPSGSVYLTEPGPQQRTAAQHIVEVELFVVRIEQLVAIGIANDAVRPRLVPAHTEVRFGDGVGIEHR